MATRYSLGRPGSKRVMAPPPVPSQVWPPPIAREVRFHDVETMHIYSRSWETTAKVLSTRIKQTRSGDVLYHAILADLDGAKMDAVAYDRQAYRFNDNLHTAEVYLFRNVGFEMCEMPPPISLTMSSGYYVVLHARTEFHLAGPDVYVPSLPPRFMSFGDVNRLRNRMLADVIGLVVHVGPFMYQESFQRTTPCLDVTLMNTRYDKLDNNISSCNMIYLPYASIGRYILYVIDKETRHVYIMDPIYTSQSSETKNLRHVVKLKSFAREFKEALEIKLPGWNSDISKWQRLFPSGISTSIDGDVSGYFVFHFMLWWNGKELVKPCADGYELRKHFLLYLLKHRGNEAKGNIPDIVQEFLKRIK